MNGRLGCAIATMLLASAGSSVAAEKESDRLWNTTIDYHGYVKMDLIASRYGDGDPGATNALRDFYIPGLIPVGGDAYGGLDMHAKQSRFWFETKSYYYGDTPLISHFQFDFMLSPGGDERISNSYNPRLRHVFFKFGGLLFGQTWSTLMDLKAYPETLDFVGASDGLIFVRQAQFRYSQGPWQFAIENPEITLLPRGGGSRSLSGDQVLPDFIVRYTQPTEYGHLGAAAILRQLKMDDPALVVDSEIAWGVYLTGKHTMGEDDIRFGFSTGEGLGRYVGLNASNDAVVIIEPGPGQQLVTGLRAIPTYSAYIGWRHRWNEQWRSNLIYSAFGADNNVADTGTAVTKTTTSLHVNALYTWRPKVTFGIEYLRAERELEDGQEGTLDRFQCSAKFDF